jgi:hypothetical protein
MEYDISCTHYDKPCTIYDKRIALCDVASWNCDQFGRCRRSIRGENGRVDGLGRFASRDCPMSLTSFHQGDGFDSLSPPKRGEGWGEGH